MNPRKPDYGRIELHGWDSRSQSWHGPDEISFSAAGTARILNQLRELHGSWHGKLRTQGPDVPALTLCAQIYDLGDVGLATVDMEGSPGGPIEIALVVPSARRGRLRPELAFEFASFLRFLEGPQSQGAEMAIHDHIERAIKESDPASTLVISVDTRSVAPEAHILIAATAEKLTMTLIAWMAEKDFVAASSD